MTRLLSNQLHTASALFWIYFETYLFSLRVPLQLFVFGVLLPLNMFMTSTHRRSNNVILCWFFFSLSVCPLEPLKPGHSLGHCPGKYVVSTFQYDFFCPVWVSGNAKRWIIVNLTQHLAWKMKKYVVQVMFLTAGILHTEYVGRYFLW